MVVKQRRYECTCKRIADLNVTFCEKEEQRYERTLIFIKNQSKRYIACSDVVGMTGFEPAASSSRSDARM